MPRQTPADVSTDAVTVALQNRRKHRTWLGIAVTALLASAAWSHSRSPADAGQWEGRPLTVDAVIDGDTLVVSGVGHRPQIVRLRGIDAPDLARHGLPAAHFADRSKQYLAARLTKDGQPASVLLKFDGTERRDDDGRLLAYVYLGDSDCINVDLVRDGMAYVDRRSKTMHQSTLEQVENNARTRGIGLWKDLTPHQMPAWRQVWLDKWMKRPAK